MAVHSKAIRLLRIVYSVPERYAKAVEQDNKDRLLMPYAGPMNSNRLPLGMNDSTRRCRMTMIFDKSIFQQETIDILKWFLKSARN